MKEVLSGREVEEDMIRLLKHNKTLVDVPHPEENAESQHLREDFDLILCAGVQS